jgi:hypothetical protein
MCIPGGTDSINCQNKKKLIRTNKLYEPAQQIIWTSTTNMYTYGTNSRKSQDKIFVNTEQFIWICYKL